MEFSAGADVPEVSVGYHVGNIYRDVEIRQQPAEASELRQLAIDLAPKVKKACNLKKTCNLKHPWLHSFGIV